MSSTKEPENNKEASTPLVKPQRRRFLRGLAFATVSVSAILGLAVVFWFLTNEIGKPVLMVASISSCELEICQQPSGHIKDASNTDETLGQLEDDRNAQPMAFGKR